MKHNIKFGQSAGFLVGFLMCIHMPANGQKEFYIPKSLFIPVHDAGGQVFLALSKGGGTDLNASVSFAKHWVVFGAATVRNGTARKTFLFGDQYEMVKDDYALRAGIGYFKVFPLAWLNVWEMYAGAGSYKVDNYWYFVATDPMFPSTDVTKTRFRNYFWQINGSHKTDRHELAFALRLAHSVYDPVLYYNTHQNTGNLKNLIYGLQGTTLDPAVSYSYKWNRFKFNVQFGVSLPYSSSIVQDVSTNIFTDTTIVRAKSYRMPLTTVVGKVGVQYMIDLRGKRKKEAAN